MSTPLHAQFHTHILQYSTHIIFTHTHPYKNYMLTHNPTTYIHNPPYSPHDSHIHMNTDHYTHIPHTPMRTHPQHCIRSPLFTHTPPHKTSVCIYIHPFHVHAHTLHMQLSLHLSTSTHTLLLHYPHPPYPHSYTPLHTCTQTHKLTHTSFTPPYSKMLMTSSPHPWASYPGVSFLPVQAAFVTIPYSDPFLQPGWSLSFFGGCELLLTAQHSLPATQ